MEKPLFIAFLNPSFFQSLRAFDSDVILIFLLERGLREITTGFLKSTYSTSLNHDENTWDILNQGLYNGFSQSSKRESLDNKIADRELVQQKGFNPFLNDSNYVQDIEVSNLYLKPQNTTHEREKNNTNNT